MAKRSSSSSSLFLPFILPRGDTLYYILSLLSILSLISHHLRHCSAATSTPFEGFDDADDDDSDDLDPLLLTPSPKTLTRSESTHPLPDPPNPSPPADPDVSPPTATATAAGLDDWDEDEFEGIPTQKPLETPKITEPATPVDPEAKSDSVRVSKPRSFTVEIICVSFLIAFAINFFTGKKENEKIALSWAAKFATKDSIFDKNFSLLGVGEGDDSPLLLKEGQNVFKFYASGRRFCLGLLATMELKSRHDLISRIVNLVVPSKDEISIEVFMNDEAMDHVVLAVAKKKMAKGMHKEMVDLQRYASLMSSSPGNRKWVPEELSVIAESKEVAAELISETVLDQVLGEKAFEKFGKGFMYMHFSDQHLGKNKKMLLFKFALPDASNMADMTRLVALIPYYIDLIGRYKLSPQARSKTEGARSKAAQEVYKELQNARQEVLQRKKAERRKMAEEAEAKLSAEAIRKKEAKERSRQMKKSMPKVKMTRAG